jgi:hypothetical protein
MIEEQKTPPFCHDRIAATFFNNINFYANTILLVFILFTCPHKRDHTRGRERFTKRERRFEPVTSASLGLFYSYLAGEIATSRAPSGKSIV